METAIYILMAQVSRSHSLQRWILERSMILLGYSKSKQNGISGKGRWICFSKWSLHGTAKVKSAPTPTPVTQ